MTAEQQEGYDTALLTIQRVKEDNSPELNLAYLKLSQLPPEIDELTSLQAMFLKGNSLTNLPREIAQLTSLIWLDLSDNNNLTDLPPEIGKLTSLKVLVLDNNRLTHLPSEISELTSLKSLSLINNKLTDLPAEMAQLTSMSRLYLNDNDLKVLPQCLIQLDMDILWIDGTTTDEGINLYGNPLEEPPIEVVKQGKEAIKAWFKNK